MLQKSLETLANLIVKERPITVVITDDFSASTDGHHIRLSLHPALRAEPPEKIYQYLTTLLYHEVGHVIYSSFQAYYDTVRSYLNTFESKDAIMRQKLEHVIKQFCNAFEDVRVERLMSRDYSLAKNYFFELNQQLLALPANTIKEHEIILDHLLNLAFLANQNKLPNALSIEAKSFARRLRKKLPKIAAANSTSICLEMLIKTLKPYGHLLKRWASAISIEELQLEPDYLTVPIYEHAYTRKHHHRFKDETMHYSLEYVNQNQQDLTGMIEVIECDITPMTPPPFIKTEIHKLRESIKHIWEVFEKYPLNATSGQLNKRKLHNLMCFRTDLFSKKMRVVRKVAFSILVDISGSMKGEKLEKAFTLAAVMEAGLKNIGLVEIAAFTTRNHNASHYVIKSFSHDTDDLSRVWGFFKNINPDHNGNIEDENIKLAGERLLKHKTHQKILFVICDAVPCVDGTDQKAKTVVNKLKSEGVITVALLLDVWNNDSENHKRAREIYNHVLHFKNEKIGPNWTTDMSRLLRRICL